MCVIITTGTFFDVISRVLIRVHPWSVIVTSAGGHSWVLLEPIEYNWDKFYNDTTIKESTTQKISIYPPIKTVSRHFWNVKKLKIPLKSSRKILMFPTITIYFIVLLLSLLFRSNEKSSCLNALSLVRPVSLWHAHTFLISNLVPITLVSIVKRCPFCG